MTQTVDDVEIRRAEIHRLHAEGRSVREIVQQVGCSRMTVYRSLARPPGPDGRRPGLQPNHGVGWAAAHPEAAAAICALTRAGLATDEIAAQVARAFGEAVPQKTVERLVVAQKRASDSYRGLSPADREAAAAADPDSMDAEIELLRAFIHSLTGQVETAGASDQARFALIRLIRELTDSVARAFRASRAGPTSSQPDELAGEVAEERRVQETSNGAHVSADPPVGRA